ncbi:MAG: SAM-dependent methyltransferase [Cystobacterineae bacterium]|nr:SAM-dependent methyltransferase [Cystobacterineae bacterium]
MDESAYEKDISAVAAKFEAQKIAFAPLAFQAVRALRDLNILRAVEKAGNLGLSREEVAQQAGISTYGAGVLLEMALGLGVVKWASTPAHVCNTHRAGASTIQQPMEGPVECPVERPEERPEEGPEEGPEERFVERFVLGKTGWFLLEDEMTEVNFNFVNDLCYQGAFRLKEAIQTGKPQGLEVFGCWPTIYDALASLPKEAQKSWLEFDHFYSSIAFPEALPLVFRHPKPSSLLDIGGNTAKWAVLCCKYDNTIQITVADLPGQTAMAEKNAAAAGFAKRISTYPCNVLAPGSALPQGHEAIWMSQFLDCFALEDVTKICQKVAAVCTAQTRVYVLEPLWDKQCFEAAAFSLQATSLYFTCMANGRSKMYRYEELKQAIEAGGLSLTEEWHNLGSNSYSLLGFRLGT